MTVGTAARNNSPSWFKISTDQSGTSDHARLYVFSGEPEVHTRTAGYS
jgi:hypothetical protein